ncbi:MAG TPA: MarR family transcriptional regulator [Candidatus Limnocylindrales bacterium]|nr:MarR family transcriptional regulator [Candidatus Limnocylindrales bacterium]
MSDLPTIRQAVRGSAYEEAIAERLGMNPTDLRALEQVLAEPGLSPGRLAELSVLTTGAITGVLDRLEAAGYVQRLPDPSDRRRIAVLPLGPAAQVREMVERLDSTIGGLLAERSPAERQAILEFLAAMAEAVTDDTVKLRASTRGGFVGSTYIAPASDAARARLLYSTGAPRLAMNIAPLGPRASARVIAETSASRLRFTGATTGDDLIRATFDGPRPEARSAAGVVTMRFKRSIAGAFSTRRAEVALRAGVPWSIELDGGITDLTGSLAGVTVERLEVGGGANHVDLELGAPVGTTLVRLNGVASSARFRRPAGVPVALRVDGGIAHLRLDGQRIEQVAGERRFASPGFAGSADRYEIEILGGASDVRIAADQAGR